ncbi:hypothetical protein TraAM80_02083 [Trypanosoma rangeli]|uniref:Uncharacterized protein n=1 Tax=Trypanosoma rangeli TaxID=5698 RepID=A0A422NVV9_TRYRA|nr:uncharacterized protein TraAM80_02083 [Trypanosoma rangeli]RNF09599.1 hypothetical protein TraAM80_02083 [Trypanosoma rangeli]|eukprot:RNF09599.1 hypothetical protein TraAM80_02083 [Trypanosoma rangeli]
MSRTVTKEQYASVRKVERMLLGACLTTPRQGLLDPHSMGIINFLSGKESKLQALMRQLDVGAHKSLQPIKLLVEFMSFIVGGLTIEADKIEEAVCDARKAVAALTHEIQRRKLELGCRKQYSGTNVTRTLDQFYRTKRAIFLSTANRRGNEEGYTHDLILAITEDRTLLQENRRILRVLIMVQRLLWGSGNVSEEDIECMLRDFSIPLTIRRFHHKLRDLMLLLKPEARSSLKCLLSLGEFIANVHIGLSAATEDLDVCLFSLKKCILMQEEDLRVRRINALREAPSVEVSSVFHLSGPNRRTSTSARETEELSKLYCS